MLQQNLVNVFAISCLFFSYFTNVKFFCFVPNLADVNLRDASEFVMLRYSIIFRVLILIFVFCVTCRGSLQTMSLHSSVCFAALLYTYYVLFNVFSSEMSAKICS